MSYDPNIGRANPPKITIFKHAVLLHKIYPLKLAFIQFWPETLQTNLATISSLQKCKIVKTFCVFNVSHVFNYFMYS